MGVQAQPPVFGVFGWLSAILPVCHHKHVVSCPALLNGLQTRIDNKHKHTINTSINLLLYVLHLMWTLHTHNGLRAVAHNLLCDTCLAQSK